MIDLRRALEFRVSECDCADDHEREESREHISPLAISLRLGLIKRAFIFRSSNIPIHILHRRMLGLEPFRPSSDRVRSAFGNDFRIQAAPTLPVMLDFTMAVLIHEFLPFGFSGAFT
jgi:hypothetical protein